MVSSFRSIRSAELAREQVIRRWKELTRPLPAAFAVGIMTETPAPTPEIAAAREALKRQPRDLATILALGDACHAAGLSQDAGQAYSVAIRIAGQQGQPAPPAGSALDIALRRAGMRVAEYAAGYEAFLRSRLGGHEAGARIDEALDLLFGKRQIYFQRPTRFYFPGLPQIQFYDRRDFDWVPGLEAETAAIREELLAVMREDRAFQPYVEADETRPHVRNTHLTGNADWSAFYIWKNGALVDENAERCPRTAAAIADLPFDRIPGQAPSVLFSRLEPGTRIPPHHGLVNTRLVCHLPLLVPGSAYLRVGNETRAWREGEVVIFDDSIEHEAWNEADQTRVVLLFDIWRPELSEAERRAVTDIFAAIAERTGSAVASG